MTDYDPKLGWVTGEHRLHSNVSPSNYDKFTQIAFNYVAPYAPTNILDFGCGDGSLTVRMKQRLGKECRLSGVDISPVFIDLAKHKDASISWHVGDIERGLPFEDNSFDVIYSYVVFQYFRKSSFDVIFKEFSRITKPGGHVVHIGLCDKNKFFGWFAHPLNSPKSLIKFFLGPAFKSYLSDKLWDDGSYWHRPEDIKKYAEKYFKSVVFSSSGTRYRSDVILEAPKR